MLLLEVRVMVVAPARVRPVTALVVWGWMIRLLVMKARRKQERKTVALVRAGSRWLGFSFRGLDFGVGELRVGSLGIRELRLGEVVGLWELGELGCFDSGESFFIICPPPPPWFGWRMLEEC
jgi:hypothetical protein